MQESDKRQESRLGESVREAEDRRYSIPTRVALINSTTSRLGHQVKITRRGFLGLVPGALISATWIKQRPGWAEWVVQHPAQPPVPSKKLVWVVDDEPAVGELYRVVLKSHPSHRLTGFWAKKVLASVWLRATRHGYENQKPKAKANEE